MASTGTAKGKSKAGTSKSRRVWLKREEEYLIGLMKELLTLQWRQDNGQFRHGFLGELEKRIVQAFPGTDLRAYPHIESKLKLWKKQYNTLATMLRTSGFGWNDTEKMIEVESDEVWQEYVRRDHDAKQMRNKPFPYYDDWCTLFGRDRATGDLAEGPADAVAMIALEGCEENYETEEPHLEGEPTPTPMDASQSATGNSSAGRGAQSSSGRKRGRNDSVSQGMTDMAETFRKFVADTNATMTTIAQRIGYHQDIREARQRVNGELLKLSLDRTERLRAASLIVSDAQRLDLFFSLPEDDRIEWVYLLLGGYL